MAKRFIDTDFFKKGFVKGLDSPYKLLYFYILCECDMSGIWEIELDVASLRVGYEYDLESVKNAFGDRIQISGNKLFLVDFIPFQYGELKEGHRVHESVLRNTLSKGFRYPLQRVKDKEKDKDKDKVKDKDKEKEKDKREIIFPWTSEKFLSLWQEWKQDRAERKLKAYTFRGEQAALTKLSNGSNGREAVAVMAIQNSIAQGWQGLFPEKIIEQLQTTNGKPRFDGNDLQAKIAAKYG
jgi:hypothetical protein